MITVTEETTVDPAIIKLEDGVEYTFKIVDSDHPDGVEVSGLACWIEEESFFRWECVADTAKVIVSPTCKYTIEYTGTVNRISSVVGSDRNGWSPNYPVSFYIAESVHIIDERYINFPQEVPTPTSTVAGKALGVVLDSHTHQPTYDFISVGTVLPEPKQSNNGFTLQVGYLNSKYQYRLVDQTPIVYYYDSTRAKPNIYKNSTFTSSLTWEDASNLLSQFDAGRSILLFDGSSSARFTVTSMDSVTNSGAGYTTIYVGAVVKKVVDNTKSYEFINFYVADND